jgi:dipeptidyl aminopeptidase/acylaminoacyl peptidase
MAAGLRHWSLYIVAAIAVSTAFADAALAQTPPSAAPPQPLPPPPLTATEFVALAQLSDPALSPDGQTLAYGRSRTDWASDRNVPELMLQGLSRDAPPVDISAGQNFVVQGRAHWAPDGRSLAILARDSDAPAAQIYRFDLASARWQRLTDLPGGVAAFVWARDGKALLLSGDAPAPGHELQTHTSAPPAINAYDLGRAAILHRLDLASNALAPLIDMGDMIGEFSQSRDGRLLLVERRPPGDRNDADLFELWRHDLERGTGERLTANSHRERAAKFSPDNRQFAYIADVSASGAPYYEDRVFIQPIDGGLPRRLLPNTPMEVIDFDWSKDGEALYILGNIGVRQELFRYHLASARLDRLTHGDHVLSDWRYDPENERHIALRAAADNPGEVVRFVFFDGESVALTQEHRALAQRHALSTQLAVQWQAADGQPLEGILALPPGYDPASGLRLPLVTIIHGGPRASSQFGSWHRSRALPVLTGQGYAVFLPNHRGGTGYGDGFLRDTIGNFFRSGPTDVLSGIDHLIARDIADPERLIIAGWSAGGHMVNRLITQTTRFKAASSGAGVADWVSLFGESDLRRTREPWFGGPPWGKDAPLDAYRRASPLFDAWRAKTPTLFFAGERDERVPPTQPILMHRALRAAGVATQLYVARGEGHNYRLPSNQLFKINRDLQWFAEHLGLPDYQLSVPEGAMPAPRGDPSPEPGGNAPEENGGG